MIIFIGKKRGRYMINDISPINFTGSSLYFKIISTDTAINQMISENTYEQQLVFTTLTINNAGERVVEQLNYGLSEAVTDCDGNSFEVNNDFDFFYNKHWIKNDIAILNLRKKWIGNEETKVCEKQQNIEYHGRILIGVFNTGSYVYGETMELYEANLLPTGNVETNIPGTLHYIPKIPSLGACPVMGIFKLLFSVITLPADGNTIYTAPVAPYPFVVFINPLDTPNGIHTYIETESILVTGSSTSTLWEFSEFKLNDVHCDGNAFSFQISQNSHVKAIFKEVCLYSFAISSVFESCTGTFSVPPIINFEQTPLKVKYYEGESVVISTPDTISHNYFPAAGDEDLALIEFKINGIAQTFTTVAGRATLTVSMTENKTVELKYAQGTRLTVKQLFMSSIGGHPPFSDQPKAVFMSVTDTSFAFDETYGDQIKSVGCGTEIFQILITAPTPLQIASGTQSQTTGWAVSKVRINGNEVYPGATITNSTPTGAQNSSAIIGSLFPPLGGISLPGFNSSAFLILNQDTTVEIIWSQNHFIGTEDN
jgi:hypothetical protein